MGWTVLYIAFGVVALWLLGEVLLQYKARLRWRLLAFAGFLCVVLGVLMPNVIVIGLGAIAGGWCCPPASTGSSPAPRTPRWLASIALFLFAAGLLWTSSPTMADEAPAELM